MYFIQSFNWKPKGLADFRKSWSMELKHQGGQIEKNNSDRTVAVRETGVFRLRGCPNKDTAWNPPDITALKCWGAKGMPIIRPFLCREPLVSRIEFSFYRLAMRQMASHASLNGQSWDRGNSAFLPFFFYLTEMTKSPCKFAHFHTFFWEEYLAGWLFSKYSGK